MISSLYQKGGVLHVHTDSVALAVGFWNIVEGS